MEARLAEGVRAGEFVLNPRKFCSGVIPLAGFSQGKAYGAPAFRVVNEGAMKIVIDNLDMKATGIVGAVQIAIQSYASEDTTGSVAKRCTRRISTV
jgi:hypothetical protein